MRSFEKHAMWHKVVILFSFKKHSLSLFVCSSEATWIRLHPQMLHLLLQCLRRFPPAFWQTHSTRRLHPNRVRDEETDSLTHNELVCSYKQKRKYKKVGCCSLPPGFGICGLKRRDTKRACQIVQGRLAPSPPFLFSCDWFSKCLFECPSMLCWNEYFYDFHLTPGNWRPSTKSSLRYKELPSAPQSFLPPWMFTAQRLVMVDDYLRDIVWGSSWLTKRK